VISHNTVKIHLRSIFAKFQMQKRVQVAVHTIRQGLLENDSDKNMEKNAEKF
jgi:DNA-binding NarL/FixJ family response regulator